MRGWTLFLCFVVAIAGAEILEVTKENFDTLRALNKPVIIDVNARSCHYCREMAPIFEEMSQEYGDKIQFAKMDFDSQSELARRFGVNALPTFLYFKKGKTTPFMTTTGAMSKEEFEDEIRQFLKKSP